MSGAGTERCHGQPSTRRNQPIDLLYRPIVPAFTVNAALRCPLCNRSCCPLVRLRGCLQGDTIPVSERPSVAWRGSRTRTGVGTAPFDDLAFSDPFEGLPDLPPGIRRAAVAGRLQTGPFAFYLLRTSAAFWRVLWGVRSWTGGCAVRHEVPFS